MYSRPAALLVALNYVTPAFRCGKEAQKPVAPWIKTSTFFSPHFPTFIPNAYSSFQPPLTFRWHGYLTTMRPPGGAPLWQITVVSSALETSPLAYVPSSHRRRLCWPPPYACSSSRYNPRIAEDLQQFKPPRRSQRANFENRC